MNLKDVNYLHSELARLMLRLIHYAQVYKLDKVMQWDEPLEDFFKVGETILKKRQAITRLKDSLTKELEKTKSRIQKRNRFRKAMTLLFDLVNKYIKNQEKDQKPFSSPIKEKFDYLARVLKLSTAESRLVLISFLTDIFDLTELEGIGEYDSYLDNVKALSRISGVSKPAIMNCISKKFILIGSGLFSCYRDHSALELLVMKPSFVEILLDARIKCFQIFQTYFAARNKAALPIHCFDYLQTDIEIISAILEQTHLKKRKGVNILFYGEPGTGKTTLAHSLLHSLGFERVTLEAGEKRLGKYRLCQKVYGENKKMCLVFDEAEPILNTCYQYPEPHSRDKSDIIELLENNAVPCIWIVNATEEIHSAVKRRFSYSIHFRRLSQRLTQWVVKNNLKKFRLPVKTLDEQISHFIQQNQVSLGHVTLALQRTSEIYKSGLCDREKTNTIITSILKQMVSLERAGGKIHTETDNSMTHYQHDMITIDTEVSVLTRAIRHFYDLRGKRLALPVKNLNFLFYGPPGSGKSELARYLGHILDKELLIKNASDLIDMYVGNTEKYIREAFEGAEEEDKILVLDEADSFFQKRNSAAQQWQVSQVNEILNAMEGFRGILICTTNFIDHFDPASLRRFAYKVKFFYLKIHQKVSIFNQLFEEIVQLPKKQAIADSLKSIPGLTIGDFTTVYKQAIFLPEITFSKIVGLLEKESRIKKGVHKKIGF